MCPCVQATWKKFSFFDKDLVGEQVWPAVES